MNLEDMLSGVSQSPRDQPCESIHMRSLETAGRTMVMVGGGELEMLFNQCTLSVWEDEKVLEMMVAQ